MAVPHGRAAGGGVGGEQRPLGIAPGERPVDPLLADLAHQGPPLRIVQQLRDQPGELGLVVGAGVDGGVTGGDPRLPEVEGDDRPAHHHVLQDLVHGRHVVERIARVGGEAHVRGGQVAHQVGVRNAPGELHLLREPEPPGQLHHRVEGVAAADEHRVPVGPPELVAQLREGPQGVVDAVLRAHDAQVAQQMGLAALQLRLRRYRPEPVGVRRAAHHEDVLGPPTAAAQRDVPVALVRGEHDVRGPVGPPFQRAHGAVEQVLAAVEPGEVQLGHQVVLVEDEPRAAPLQPQRRQEQQVGRVAGVDDVDRADPAGQPGGVPQRRSVLPQVAGRPSGGGAQRVAVDPHPVDHRFRLGVPLLSLRADDVHLPARVAQRRALLPHPPVERHREVLHQDQRATGPPVAADRVIERCVTKQGPRTPVRPGAPRRREGG